MEEKLPLLLDRSRTWHVDVQTSGNESDSLSVLSLLSSDSGYSVSEGCFVRQDSYDVPSDAHRSDGVWSRMSEGLHTPDSEADSCLSPDLCSEELSEKLSIEHLKGDRLLNWLRIRSHEPIIRVGSRSSLVDYIIAHALLNAIDIGADLKHHLGFHGVAGRCALRLPGGVKLPEMDKRSLHEALVTIMNDVEIQWAAAQTVRESLLLSQMIPLLQSGEPDAAIFQDIVRQVAYQLLHKMVIALGILPDLCLNRRETML